MVDPEKVEEISAAMKYIALNPSIKKRMGENGRKAIQFKYNWEAESKKLLEAYEDVLYGKISIGSESW